MSERIVIGGASGFMGRRLAASFRADGAEVVTIGRSAGEIPWSDAGLIRRAVDGASLVIGLSGKSVDCRYNAANRAEILRSRVETTEALGAAIAASDNPAPLWVNASTATIYRHAEDRPQTESTGELGEGFSVGIAKAWEAAFFAPELPATRRVALRTAITLGDGSALVPLINLARNGFGGPALDGRWPATQGRLDAGTYHRFRARGGRQKFSWVHLDDVVGVIRFLRAHAELDGVVNVTSPNPTDNRTMMATLRRVLGVPFGLPLPRWVLELGAAAIHTETELVLKSRWVLPERLLAAGYEFHYPELEPALRQIVAERRGK
ncbi:TIGR01777 family oxidoreductase [Gryllotalpicola daejeonensis]|uniref:TIGR01777 family oxidoreductase n=1 Tax=Gryllotalpicola daejeonensis TaxID=993087 RepID=A0ABP7ZE68_9MICO